MARGDRTCMAEGCPVICPPSRPICRGHWFALPVELRERWLRAWLQDCRWRSWAPVRREMVEYLSAHRG